MGRSSIPAVLHELAHPRAPAVHAAALSSLKNEIVGHGQRKELAVAHGVVRPLARLLGAWRGDEDGLDDGRAAREDGWTASTSWTASNGWTASHEVRLQATLVVGSLANGGPAFVSPLLAGNVLPPLLDALRPGDTPARLLTATLTALMQIVDAAAHEKPGGDVAGPALAALVSDQIYTAPAIECLAEILALSPSSLQASQHILLAMQLVTKTCRDDTHKRMLVDAGILDHLAAHLAAMAAVDRASFQANPAQTRCTLPARFLPHVLDAISAIINDSCFYTACFLYSQPVQNIFGWPKDRTTTAYDPAQLSWDALIPRVQTMTSKTDPYTKSWPALGSHTAACGESARLPSMDALQQAVSSRSVITDESESPLFIWLMYVARRGEGTERLSVCYLLALLKKFGERWPLNDPCKTARERHFSYLVIPLVVKMIEESSPTSEQSKRAHALGPQARDEMRAVRERSPLVLAELIAGNKPLQTAAVDARILPTLVQILKKSFDVVTTSAKPLWQPRSVASQVADPAIDPASSTLGRPGLSIDILHALKYRESTLLALAAIAGDQDGLRKLVIEMGAATHIIEALVPYVESGEQTAAAAKNGNPEAVLIAACKVTRSLSRSVSVLRTSLIDHGIAQPVFELLTHPSVKVQIAATEVITNLVLEVSPMRTEIIEAGVLKTLCEHCRSANFDLRYGSLWALKHLCLGIPYAMKIQCLEELGVGWLVQVLNGEPTKPAMGTPNAVGEQVDLLNAIDEPHMDVDEEPSSDEGDSTPSMRRHQRTGSRYTSPTNIRDRLEQIKNDELDVRLNSERDDVRIQEQALDFIRNFVTEDKASGEMIDHLLKTFGHTRFFELLDAKIRPKNTPAPATSQQASPNTPSYWPNATQRPSFPSASLSTPNWATYPATELIQATIFILVHLANGRPTHRSLLISQTQLMAHVLPLLTHPKRDIRLGCAWMLNNLIWIEDASDEAATRERALSLRALGFEDGARILGRDMDLDIRERAKTALDLLARLLEGRGGAAAASASAAAAAGASAPGSSGFAGAPGFEGRAARLGAGGWRHEGRS